MRENTGRPETIDSRIAARLKELRAARGWSLDELAKRSEVSRATLSRLEKAEVSASAAVLGKLCAVYGLPMSRLIMMAEAGYTPLLHPADQPIWKDAKAGFTRRSLSPPAEARGKTGRKARGRGLCAFSRRQLALPAFRGEFL
jgi:transcriptional regulator with XRE-family HTH domain